jgi:hypothetical protein
MNPIIQATEHLHATRADLLGATTAEREVIDALARLTRPTPRAGLDLDAWAAAEAQRAAKVTPLETLKRERMAARTRAQDRVQQAERGLADAEEAHIIWQQRADRTAKDAQRYATFGPRLDAARAELRAIAVGLGAPQLETAVNHVGETLQILRQGAAEHEQARSMLAMYDLPDASGAAGKV